jgi:hypothetical protein
LKTLDIHRQAVLPRHLAQAEEFGDDSLDSKPPESFYEGCPQVPGFDRAEPGCLLAMCKCVMPHSDTWLGDWDRVPRVQRSFFWLLSGEVTFKVDGYAHRQMQAGDWVVFDHRREHMVLADDYWRGAAWQLRASRKTPNVGAKLETTAPAQK